MRPGTVGTWCAGDSPAAFDASALEGIISGFRETAYVIRDEETGRLGVGLGGRLGNDLGNETEGWPCVGVLPPLYPEWLGDRSFQDVHGVRFPYVAGAMARGIGSVEIVVAMGAAGMLGFFGSAGLPLDVVEGALVAIRERSPEGASWGCNLIHSPQEPELENALAALLVRHDVKRISASAFMSLTPAVVQAAYAGVRAHSDGTVLRPRHIFAKVSRPEVARRFMGPPPAEILDHLTSLGALSAQEAALAAHLPVAEDVTVESDSGGHTDNQPLGALFPVIQAARDEMVSTFSSAPTIRLGAAGSLGTPAAVAGAFALGAAYVVTGSVNQSAVEAGVSESARLMLADADLADVTMCPSADMFEMGVKVQVLKRGTLFAMRASRLYELYKNHPSLDALPKTERDRLEKDVFRTSLDEIWMQTERFWSERNPEEVRRAREDPRHQMALVFRWYLGQSSRWPIAGEASRRTDYQLWCGPAMGSFNAWVKGSFLEAPENRSVVQIARNLLEGAAALTRAGQVRTFGVPLPLHSYRFRPRPLK